MNRLVGLALASLLFVACATNSEAAAERVVITWFVGLGTGSQPEHLQPQERVVERFNRGQDEIELRLEIVDYSAAYDDLWDRIDAGEAPDIVGPVGVQGANEFAGEFLDLAPYLDIDTLADVDPAQVDLLQEGDTLWGLPIGVFPSMMFVNAELFSRAGLELPPTEPGGTYEGRPWDMTALTDLAERLTLDAEGRNAQDPAFEPQKVVQWGFHHQHMGDPRSHGTFFGPGELEVDGRAVIPEPWLEEWRWLHSMIHDKGVSPDIDQEHSDVLRGGNAFATGRVAMAYSHLWYVPSITSPDGVPLTFWRFAMVPENNGVVTAKVHADSLRLLASSKHPEAAAEVLRYLHEEAGEELLRVYGSFPARLDLQGTFVDSLAESYPQDVDWDVIARSLEFPDNPSHEAALPAQAESRGLLDDFDEALRGEPDLDVDAAAEELARDLQVVFDRG